MAEPSADLREQDTAPVGEPDPAPAGSGPGAQGAPEEAEQSGPIVRDKRRLDPETGKVRQAYAASEPAPPSGEGAGAAQPSGGDSPAPATGSPATGSPATGSPAADPSAAGSPVAGRAEELLGDLQRLQAEYVNYRRRVDRDRNVARDLAVAGVLESLLPVLDDVHLARQHGDLETGPFSAIAEKLESILGRFGLERYGEVGEVFDPTVHEALMHTRAELAEGTTETTVVQVMQPGYRCGERLLRAARVAVADPS